MNQLELKYRSLLRRSTNELLIGEPQEGAEE